jgi:hypothetical protein
MADILPFPTKPVRDWAEIEKSLRAVLAQPGVPADMVEAVVTGMKPVVLKYSRGFSTSLNLRLPAGATAQEGEAIGDAVRTCLTEMERQFQELMHEVLLDRLYLEIELYGLRRRTNQYAARSRS